MARPNSGGIKVRRCKHCGCTDSQGCEEGCWWVGVDVCSSCQPLRALSVLQPWAWLLANGLKDVENRTWRTHFRGRFLIHAGKRWGAEQRDDVAWVRHRFPSIKLPERFDVGGIVGEATIVDCVTDSCSGWFNGPFGFVIRDPAVLPFLPCRGMLGFFQPAVSHG